MKRRRVLEGSWDGQCDQRLRAMDRDAGYGWNSDAGLVDSQR